jgi:nucleotide-binding universal stress UspA family protein
MRPVQKILVPLDFSAQSAEALAYAADLARRYDASLTLAHVYQPVNYAAAEGFRLYTPEQLTTLLDELHQQLRAAEAEARAIGAPRIALVTLQGDPFSELLELARKESFDMIVMGTHGRTGFRHALLGSIAEKLVRSAPCPVLTVRLPQ